MVDWNEAYWVMMAKRDRTPTLRVAILDIEPPEVALAEAYMTDLLHLELDHHHLELLGAGFPAWAAEKIGAPQNGRPPWMG